MRSSRSQPMSSSRRKSSVNSLASRLAVSKSPSSSLSARRRGRPGARPGARGRHLVWCRSSLRPPRSWRFSLRSGTEGAAVPDAAALTGCGGTVSPASKAFPSVPGPGALVAPPGPLFQLSRPNLGGRKRRLKACRRTSLGPHVAPGVAPAAISHCSSDPQKPGIPLHKRGSANAPDRIRTCDLRFRRLTPQTRWTTWSPVSSGFRRIELRGDRLESVGHVAPIVAPGPPFSKRPVSQLVPLTTIIVTLMLRGRHSLRRSNADQDPRISFSRDLPRSQRHSRAT